MARFQTTSRVVEAIQYKPNNYYDKEKADPFIQHMEGCSWEQGDDCIFIHHEGGKVIVEPEDWIVKVDGHYFPVPWQLFALMFDPASNQDILTCANDKEHCLISWGRCITLHGRRG